LVTGSGRGIGRAIAQLFAREGAAVAVNASTEKNALKTMKEIKEAGGKAISLPGDVGDYRVVEKIFGQLLEEWGTIDILVNNAGISPKNEKGYRKTVVEMSREEWERVVAVNLNGMFYCCQEALKVMLPKKSGVIINLTSIAAFVPNNITGAHYMATKAAAIGLTRALVGEFAEQGIRINAISPGRIETEMVAGADKNLNEGFRRTIPMQRFGTTRELAEGALFLASDAASYINGIVLDVDGGGVKIV
jgi:3-oxoacyl-[acyl-carrier protein] reductase